MNVDVLENGFTTAEVRLCIKSEVKISVAPRTLRRWRQRLDIRPCKFGTYTEKQLDALVSLAVWLRSGRNIDHFIAEYISQLEEL